MATVEQVDILVIGAGPAGIAAAQYLQKQRQRQQQKPSFCVLEARSRVGGRAYASDSLGVNKILDHGARWIHGTSNENAMVKQLMHMNFDAFPDDKGMGYKLNLPDSMKEKQEQSGNPPPFEMSDSIPSKPQIEHMIVTSQNYKVEQQVPTSRITKILNSSTSGSGDAILARDVSKDAGRLAKQIFKDVVMPVVKCPSPKTNKNVSLAEVLFGDDKQWDDKEFDLFCRNQLVVPHKGVQEILESLKNEEDREKLVDQVMALFNLEIYTYFESWEGAPIHQIDARNGMEGTCLSGCNVTLPFGYGGLVQRLAYPLVEHIHLEHEVISVTTNAESKQNNPHSESAKVVVRSKNPDGSTKEWRVSACILTLPLGVLRAAISGRSSIQFDPQLPSPVVQAIERLGITVRNKIELLFPSRWWPNDLGRFHIACSHLHQRPTYHPYTTFICESASINNDDNVPNILVCYIAGEFARETESKSDEQIQEECMSVLRQAQIARAEIPDPTAIFVTRWLSDPFSRGSWTFYGKGSAPDDIRAFRSNNECKDRRLFFAGEHTCVGDCLGDDLGCVHGAWLSGELAAEAALQSLRSSSE